MVLRPVPRPARCLLALAAGVLLALALAPRARAEEAIVLDNGTVLRGNVIREDGDTIVFRLAGLSSDNRLTIDRRHVAQRFVTVDPERWKDALHPEAPVPRSAAAQAPVVVLDAPPVAAPVALAGLAAGLPAEEPDVREEGFFQRLARRATQAFPPDPSSRGLLAGLGLLLLLCLVAIGGRMADVQGLSLGKSTALAPFLGLLLVADVAFADIFLRADRATVFLPLQLLAWVGCAALLVRCGFARAFTLLAFVLFSGALVTFSTSAVLVLV